jgi:hypothetical protein
MKLIALQNHTPDGLLYVKVGQEFEFPAIEAQVLIASRLAKPAEELTEKKPGQYRRRDIRADK